VKRPVRLPAVARGMRIGLLGGSFNPPHAAHRALSLLALRRLDLDRVWWLVTPGNPLKDNRRLPPLDKRVAAARALARHTAIDVTAVEAALGTRYTYDTVLKLCRRFPGVHFVFIMGADNLAQLNRWRRWRELASLVPIAVVDRPDRNLAARASPAAMALARARRDPRSARKLALMRPPAWVFLHGVKSSLSSTALRARATRHPAGS
jgi:nicotinate-nucleotide adenylyltransferase